MDAIRLLTAVQFNDRVILRNMCKISIETTMTIYPFNRLQYLFQKRWVIEYCILGQQIKMIFKKNNTQK